MRASVTQGLDYGCGVACFAFVCDTTFLQAVKLLGREYSVKHGWRPSDLVTALNQCGLHYKNHYVRNKAELSYPDGSIILIERSSAYPVGHYLVSYDGKWMDPWINMTEDNNLSNARSGFRDKLPGKSMYALIPISASFGRYNQKR